MKLLEYIRGNKKGKDAQNIERRALQDPFLADALEGFDSVSGDHIRRIEEMQQKIIHKTSPKKYTLYKAVVGIASVVLLFSYLFLFERDKGTSFTEMENLYSMNEAEDIAIYIPEEYVQKRKLEVINEKERNVDSNINKKRVQADIVNLDELFLPEEAITIYVPEEYFERQNLKDDTYLYVGVDI